MKAKTICAAILMIVAISCTKNSNPEHGYWIIKETEHPIISTVRNTSSNGYFILSGINSKSSPDTLQIYLSSVPTKSAKFTVVPFRNSPPLAIDEMGFKLSSYSGSVYYSTGIGDTQTWRVADKADLVVANGKITVTIPTMTTFSASAASVDSFPIMAIVREQ